MMIHESETCPGLDMLIDYANGVIDPEEAETLEDHISGCGTCRMEYERLQRLIALSSPTDIDDPGDSFNTGVWNRINRGSGRTRAGLVLIPLAAAAIALFFIIPRGSPDMTGDDVIVERLDLYRHMDVIDNMDILMKLDAVLDSEDGSGT